MSAVATPITIRSDSAAADSGVERRVRAQQDEPQPLVRTAPRVGHHALGLLGQLGLDGEYGQLLGSDRLGAEAVEDAAPGGGQQPGGRVGRRTVGRPGTRRGLEGQ